MTADLHIHSTASDGLMSPAEVVTAANSLHLETIALTDHDSIAGVLAAKKAAEGLDVTLINGVEITACFERREIHLLAYAFNIKDEGLNACLQDHKKARIERAKYIIDRLGKKGLHVTIDEVRAEAISSNICRPHIAAVLVEKGYVATPREAFIRFLSDEALGEMQNFYRNLKDVIAVVKQAGGVAVIAHPGRLYSDMQLNKIISAGIDGIETVHPAHTYVIQQKLEQLALKNDLLTTGGSDFHGRRRTYYRHFGMLGVNGEDVEKINRLASHRK